MPTSPICARCGEPVNPGARFCMKCGADVSGEQGSVATAMLPAAQERDANEVALELLRQATLGEYEILRELGRGGMATVYLAHDIALDRKVAIKVMAPALLLMGEGMVERFKREARTAASLSHPHIIPIYAVKSQGRALFFVMKFIPGKSLEAIIREVGPLPISMAQAILQQVAGALGSAHRRGIVHRDVKPANIMLDEEGWSVVTDFGIAKVAESRGLTMTGIAVGTPSYMSPEQCAAKDITGKSDQYSLGVVAYEMLTGKQPFDADSAMAIMFAHFHEQPKPIQELRPDCPAPLAGAVMRMLEKAPDARWPTIEDAAVGIGGKQLSHDDPILLQLVELVKGSPNRQLLDEVAIPPTSLVPPGRPSDATTPIPPPKVASVTVSPATSSVTVGEPLQLTATPRAVGGTGLGGRVAWVSSAPAIASVSSAGLVTAIAPGKATITATCDGVSGTSAVTVTPVPVATVAVVPTERSLIVEEALQLEAVARDEHGGVLSGRAVGWTSSAPAIARVNATGLAEAVAPGTAEISATIEGKSGTARLSVAAIPVKTVSLTPPATLVVGEVAQLSATLKDAKGRALGGRTMSWTSANPAVAKLSATGQLTAVAPGTSQLTVTCEGVSATAPVTVTPVPVHSVTVQAPPTIHVGDTHQLVAALKDARGNALTGRTISWASAERAIATVSADGLMTAVAPGTVKLTATAEGKSWTVSATITPVPVASLAVTAVPPTLQVGETARLGLLLKDAKGNPLTGREVAWTSDNTAIARVTQAGVVTARAAGATSITATSEGKKISAPITVVAAPAPAAATPDPALQGAETLRLERTPPPAPRAEPAARPAPRETTAPHAVPKVEEARPTVEAARPAALEKKRAPVALIGAVVVVLILGGTWFALRPGPRRPAPPGPVASAGVRSVVVSPLAGPVTVGRTVQLTASVRDSSGAELTGRSTSWSSSDTSIARVSDNGAVTALREGTATITAVSEGQSGTAAFAVEPGVRGEVIPAAVASILLAPATKSLEVGATQQLSVTLKDVKGGVLTNRAVVWNADDQHIATVTPQGLVTAVAPGSTTITAGSEGKSGTAAITVVAPAPAPVATVSLTPAAAQLTVGETVQLAAALLDGKRQPLADRAITWSSGNQRIASVSSSGVVTAVAAGSTTVTATSEGKSGAAEVTVKAPLPKPPIIAPVTSVQIQAPVRALKQGESSSYAVLLKDAKGNLLTDRKVNWTSSNPQVATVSPSGEVSAVGPGTTTITASSESGNASVALTVAKPAPIAVASVAIQAASRGFKPGETASYTALIKDAKGNLLTDRKVTWTSSNAQVATVTPNGDITAVAPGSATITATSESVTESVNLTVAKAVVPVASVALGAAPKSLKPGETAQLAAMPRDGHNTPLPDRSVTWSSENPKVATISSSGLVTAVAPGSVEISATSEGKSASVTVSVAAAAAPPAGPSGPPTPPPVAAGSSTIPRLSLSAGGVHTCGLMAGGGLVCWGGGRPEPASIASGTMTQVSVGANHACALTSGGKAICWGDNRAGQLGRGTVSGQPEAPEPVSGEVGFTQISAGGGHTCALTSSGKAYCWGRNKSGQVGDGSTSDRLRPVAVTGNQTFSAISASGEHTCAITGQGKAYCWGDGWSGALGYGPLGAESEPVGVSGNLKFTSIASGGTHTCGLTGAGKAYCWGENKQGQLGDGSNDDRPTPAAVSTGLAFQSIDAGASHNCAITASGEAYCWGLNRTGQLGDGSKNNRNKPVAVWGGLSFTTITTGFEHTCGVTKTQQTMCWGANTRGQLGVGPADPRTAPGPVGGN